MNKYLLKHVIISIGRGIILFILGILVSSFFNVLPESFNNFLSHLILGVCLFVGGFISETTSKEKIIWNKWIYSFTITFLVVIPAIFLLKDLLSIGFFFIFLFFVSFAGGITGEIVKNFHRFC